MGLRAPYLDFIDSSIEKVFGENSQRLSMLELGDQVIKEPDIAENTGKAYFTNRGYEHISVDLNGLHGAVIRDLTKTEQFYDWHDSWDIITNSGTTEHVEPFKSQYECFSIIHDCLKVGGIAIHLVPDVHERDDHNAWRNHCRYYYSGSFFELLAKECKYDLLTNTIINGLRCVTVKKVYDKPFMKDRSKLLALIAQREYQPASSGSFAKTALRRLGAGKLLK